jgi:ABC-type sulfate/molybdate transport systems ATPase subunit
MDEPFTALDAPAAERLRADLRSRAAAGTALVIVTHHLEEAWQLATRVAVLVQGQWAAEEPKQGPLDAFLPRYHRLLGA